MSHSPYEGKPAPLASPYEHRPTRRMVSSGMLRRVALVRTDVSEELSGSFIGVTRIGELGTTPSVCVGC
jgi:hypothetical protein